MSTLDKEFPGVPTGVYPKASLGRDTVNSDLYISDGSTWQKLLRNTIPGPVLLTSLALGGALPGQALIMNPAGTAWAPSAGGHNDFVDRNLITTGTGSFGSGSTLTTIQPQVGAVTVPAIYMVAGTRTANNFTLVGTGGGGGNLAAVNGTDGVALYAGGGIAAQVKIPSGDPTTGSIDLRAAPAWTIQPLQSTVPTTTFFTISGQDAKTGSGNVGGTLLLRAGSNDGATDRGTIIIAAQAVRVASGSGLQLISLIPRDTGTSQIEFGGQSAQISHLGSAGAGITGREMSILSASFTGAGSQGEKLSFLTGTGDASAPLPNAGPIQFRPANIMQLELFIDSNVTQVFRFFNVFHLRGANGANPTISDPEGSLAIRYDNPNGSAWIRHNSTWQELARNGPGAITLTSLSLGGALPGQALIMNPAGTAWAPSVGGHNDFVDRNLITTGTGSFGSGNQKVQIRPWTGPGPVASAAIYMGSAAPTADNYVINSYPGGVGYGSGSIINAPEQTGVVGIGVGNFAVASFGMIPSLTLTDPGLSFSDSPGTTWVIGTVTRFTDNAPGDFIIRSQAAWLSATTQAKRTPGNLIYDIAAPVGDGLDGYHKFRIATRPLWSMGFIDATGVRAVAGIYPGAVTPGSNNYAFGYSVGDAGSGGVGTGCDYIVVNSPGTSMTRTTVNGVGTTGSQVRVAVNNRGVARFFVDGMFFGTAAALPTAGYVVGMLNPIVDVATVNLTIQAQAPLVGATTNILPGNVILDVPAPVSGTIHGLVKVKISGNIHAQFGRRADGISVLTLGSDVVTPVASAFATLLSDGATVTALQAPGTANSFINFAVGGHGVLALTDSTVVTGVKGLAFVYDAAYTIGQRAPVDDTTGIFDLTFQSQIPFSGATGTRRNSGGLVLRTPAPVAGGTAGSVTIQTSANNVLALNNLGALRLHAYTTPGYLQNDVLGNVTSGGITITGSVTLPALAQGGAITGQALIWNGTQWSPSAGGHNNFADRNLTTTGSVTVGAAAAGRFFFAQDAFFPAFATAYFGNVTPGFTNYSLSGDGTSTIIQAPDATGLLTISAANVGIALFTRSLAHVDSGIPGLIFWGDMAFGVSVEKPLTDAVTHDLTIQSQAPATGATVNITPGNIIYNISAPLGVGLPGRHIFKVSSTQIATIQQLVGTPSFGTLYLGNITPSATNYAVTGNGTLTVVNGHATPGAGVTLAIDGLPVMQVQSANVFNFWSAVANPIFQQDPKGDDNTPQNLTIQSQGPFSGATSTAKRTPGNLIYNIPAAVGDGLDGFHKFQVHGSQTVQIGKYPLTGVDAAIWLGAIVSSNVNWSILSDGTTGLNLSAPGAGKPIAFWSNAVYTGAWNTTGVHIGENTTGAVFEQETLTVNSGDAVAKNLSVFAQGPYASASTNKSSGGLILGTRAPLAGGTAGTVRIQIGASDAFVVNSTTKYTLFASPTWTTGTLAPTAAEPEGSRYSRTGFPNGSEYVMQAGNWVLLGAAGGSVTLGGDVTGLSTSTTVVKINGTPIGTLAGATAGQALIWNGAAWAPGDNFFAQNLTTTGNVGIGAATTANKLYLNTAAFPIDSQVLMQSNALGALSLAVFSPDNSWIGFDGSYESGNILARDTSVALWYKTNARMHLKGSTGNSVGGLAGTPSLANWSLSNGFYRLGDGAPATERLDVAGNMLISGNIWWPETTANPRIYQANLFTDGDGATITIQAQSAPDPGNFGSRGGAINLVTGTGTFVDGDVIISNGGSESARFTSTQLWLTGNGILFFGLSGPTISHNPSLFAANGLNLTVRAQDAGSGGGVHTGGNVILRSGSPSGGAASGLIQFQIAGVNSLVVNTSTKISLFSSSVTMTTGTIVPVASEIDGSLYMRTGSPNGTLYVRQNGAWVPVGGAVAWSSITGTPTTIAGYGITVLPWANVTGTPTTIAGYGITVLPWANVTGRPTTIAGYGITDAVPKTRTLTGTTPIQIDGSNGAVDLSIDRTISVLGATTGAVGVVQLASDLGGTATLPIVVGLTGVGVPLTVTMHGATIQWVTGVTPLLTQAAAAAGFNGSDFTVRAQTGGTGNTNGATLHLAAGLGVGAGAHGSVSVEAGGGATALFSVGKVSFLSSSVTWQETTSLAGLTQDTSTTGSGHDMIIHSQNGFSGGNFNGGSVIITSGVGGGSGSRGGITFKLDTIFAAGFSQLTAGLAQFNLTSTPIVQWSSTIVNPKLWQADTSAVGDTGETMLIQAQNAIGGGSSTGGALTLAAGTGLTNGNINFATAGGIALSVVGGVTSQAALTWAQNQAPTYNQIAAASGNNGATTTHSAQAGVGTNKNGGIWRAFSGGKTGSGLRGQAQLGIGDDNVVMISATEIITNKFITAFNTLVSVTTGSTGSDPGSLTMYINNCSSIPTANPVNGVLLYVDSGALTAWSPSGTITTLAAAHPHCPRCGNDFVEERRNAGRHFTICLVCMVDELDKSGVSRSKYMIHDRMAT